MIAELMVYAGPMVGAVLIGVVGWLWKTLWKRLDNQDKKMEEHTTNANEIKMMLATELRSLDVRLSVLEAQVRLLNR